MALGVVMHRPGVEYDDSVLGDELALVSEVLAGDVRRAEPEGVVAPLDLFDDCVAEGEVLCFMVGFYLLSCSRE
jgi:hypothetical protein